jgi:two-component system phosphate regulon response regulator PhoB
LTGRPTETRSGVGALAFAHRPSHGYRASALRNLVFRFDDAAAFARALQDGDQELALPHGEAVGDGEWVLAIFEIGQRRRATAAAARGLCPDPKTPAVVAFERRDWERLVEFAGAGSTRMPVAALALPADPPTEPTMTPEFVEDEITPPSGGVVWPERSAFVQDAAPADVLLVDDDPDICHLMKAMLAAAGLTAQSTTNAEDALARIRAKQPDLVVLDWNLPGMTGLELCRIIRKDPIAWRLPVLFLTANAGADDVVQAFACGADDYVTKPFRGPELGARILSLLRRASMARGVSLTR